MAARGGLARASRPFAFASIKAWVPACALPGTRAISTNVGAPTDVGAPADSPIEVPSRMLMGPGPSNLHPRAVAAMTLPELGHLHTPLLKIMDETMHGLRYMFQTSSPYVCAVSGPGHAAMEASIVNAVEPGHKVLVGNSGIWGQRIVDIARRCGAEAISLDKEAGRGFSYEEIKQAIEQHKPHAMWLCHGESSTGVFQNIDGIGDLCRKHGTLFLLDTVCTLGGVPLKADEQKVDIIYSGPQKCLSCPPGASPFFMSERAMERLQNRKSPVASYNLDMNLIGDYWGWFGKRSYHHTGLVNNFYALREALNVTSNEGLSNLWKRHHEVSEQLWDGLSAMGLKPFVSDPEESLPTVNTIKVPAGVEAPKLVQHAMDNHSIEVAGGLGPSVGKVWRIGVMGYNAMPRNVDSVLTAFRDGLEHAKTRSATG